MFKVVPKFLLRKLKQIQLPEARQECTSAALSDEDLKVMKF